MQKIRFAVVGLGHIAQNAVLPAFARAENCELTVLVTGDPEKERKLAEKYAVPAYSYDQFEDALREQRVQAVFIALPNTMHREFTERAAALGVHVLCEKPMATTEEDCRAMIQACAEAEVQLMIAYRLHFTDAHLQAVKLAQEGTLGEIRYFSSLFAMQVAEDNIRVRPETGGGTLFDIGIYCINAARYLFRSEPTEVTAAMATGDDERFDEVEEMVSAILRFPGERLAMFTCSFGSLDMDQLDLVGTMGALRIEPAYEYVGELKWSFKTAEGDVAKTFAAGDQFAGELVYFANCILENRQPEPSGAEGLADVRIINAIYEAARGGKPVSITPIHKQEHPDASQQIKRPPAEKTETVRTESPHQE